MEGYIAGDRSRRTWSVFGGTGPPSTCSIVELKLRGKKQLDQEEKLKQESVVREGVESTFRLIRVDCDFGAHDSAMLGIPQLRRLDSPVDCGCSYRLYRPPSSASLLSSVQKNFEVIAELSLAPQSSASRTITS